MPVPGPRTQFGPEPGYRNPPVGVGNRDRVGGGESYRRSPKSLHGIEDEHRLNHWEEGRPVAAMGESPGLMHINRRGNVLADGQIRRFWKQAINFIDGPPPYSWTHNAPQPGNSLNVLSGFAITRALRYMTRSVYARAGEDNTRFPGLHTQIMPRARGPQPTLGAGLVRSRPTVRNRITSFGARVPALNDPVPAAEQP